MKTPHPAIHKDVLCAEKRAVGISQVARIRRFPRENETAALKMGPRISGVGGTLGSQQVVEGVGNIHSLPHHGASYCPVFMCTEEFCRILDEV